VHFPLAFYDGFCAGCSDERPLVVVEHGPRGLRAWLSGAGPEDRTLSYGCLLCGRSEHVPLTEAEDADYDATLPTWPDILFAEVMPVAAEAAAVPAWEPAPGDVFGRAALTLLVSAAAVAAPVAVAVPAPRRPVVRVIALPGQRVSATDDHPLAVAC
jgi:hypothetical protein